METLANLEAFVRSAELGGFSSAARYMGLTPAAISRNVAQLERNLGVRLFHRNTRKLALTEAGERFLLSVRGNLDALQSAISDANADQGKPAGVLKVSVPMSLGMRYLIPTLPAFLQSYPDVRVDWQFDSRQVDLVADGFDAAIGGGFELSPGVVARPLAPAHIVAVASPSYLKGRKLPKSPDDLADWDAIVMRSGTSGRLRSWVMHHVGGDEAVVPLKARVAFNDPGPMTEAAVQGLGVALLAMPDVLPHLESGSLVRLLPRWYVDAGSISIYYSTRLSLSAKTRVFIDHVVEDFQQHQYAERFAGNSG
ncbi:LysR family transcriptional regulator [Dyella terrae]|uniref:LysR family transcriptional regulator n=1 Tax=Dyella terrae TaxID=522259 RepID=UPI001EFE5065|nr:LysR family transcriptional regulator [Dyella terrae]ULU24575.1 LysR family transcriptional regulator [Dyella terrae]